MKIIRDLFSPVLSDKHISKLIDRGWLIVDSEIREEQLQPNSVDLTLGNTISIIKPNSDEMDYIDPRKVINYDNKTFQIPMDEHSGYLLQPGEFTLMSTREVLKLPNGIIAIVCGRSSIARLGIQTEQAGFIDAGFHGTITLEVLNQTKWPILIRSGMRIAQVYFLKSKYSIQTYATKFSSKYGGQIVATGSKIHLDPEFL
jgi:dCTP deaminase